MRLKKQMMDIEEIKALHTPFGNAIVLHSPSGFRIPFDHWTELHTFENGLTADVHYIGIDTRKYAVGDCFQIRIGSLNMLDYYSSDENTVMYEYHDDKTCIALIGTETYYDEERQEFCTGRTFSFMESPSDKGMDYQIIHNPNDETLYEYYIRTQIVWIPVSGQYHAPDIIETELV